MFKNYVSFSLLMILFSVSACTVSKDPVRNRIKQLQKGKLKDDTSFVYVLPYENQKAHMVVQGYFSRFTHKNRAALDFKMKRGTTICAAREGLVVRVKEDGNRGGLKDKFRKYGNIVVIQHSDGSRAGYWHLQLNGALVNVSDTVKQGQPIGYSGKTGYSIFPHLHFIVWRSAGGNWQPMATRFQTAKGIKYLRPMRRYKRVD